MTSTLAAATVGSYQGFFAGFGGSLTPATLNGVACEVIATGLTAGKITGVFTGDVVSDFTGEDITVDSTVYSISGTPTYSAGSNDTTVEWDYAPGNFVSGNSYVLEVAASGGGAVTGTLAAQESGSDTASITGSVEDAAPSGGPDFKILRGSAIILSGQTTLLLEDGTDFTLESGIASDAWFFQIANSNLSGMGRTAGGGNQNSDDFMASASVSGNDVTLTRRGSANNCRVDWQIIQYIGSDGGDNEIKVRAKGSVTAASSSATTSVAIPGSVTSNSDLVPFITGQNNGSTDRNSPHAGLFTADINGSNIDFQRGRSNVAATVSYALVEFTGSNWTTTNEQFTNPSAANTDSTVTLGTAVADITQTFLHCQYRYDLNGTAGIDDVNTRVRLSSITQLSVRDTTSTGDSSKTNSVWVIQNPDITVARYAGTMAGSGEEEVADIAITAVDDLEQTLTTLTNDSTGAGTAMPRGFINHFLLDADTVRLRQSDNGQTSQYALEVVTLPESSGGGGITGVLSTQESGADTANISGSLGPIPIAGSLSVQEFGIDAITSTGAVAVTGVLATQDSGSDTANLSGLVPVTGVLSSQETGIDAFSGSGSVAFEGVVGDLVAVEIGVDAMSVSGFVVISGVLNTQEAGGDAALASGEISVEGDLNAAEGGADTSDMSGVVSNGDITGTLAAQEAGLDTGGIAGTVALSGDLAANESGNDNFIAIGDVSDPALNGSLSAQEVGEDVAAISGLVSISGSASASEAGFDVVSASGGVLILGSLAANDNGQDGALFSGSVPVSGNLTGVETESDVLNASGTVAFDIDGVLLVQEGYEKRVRYAGWG